MGSLMLDQTFSAQNFRRIYDIENRRGRNVDTEFFPELVEASARITTASANVRAARRDNFGLDGEQLAVVLEPLREKLRKERLDRENLVDAKLSEVANSVLGDYRIQLHEREGPGNTRLFTLPREAEAYFIAKQIQNNVARLYGLKPGNRRSIISQVYDCLNTGFRQFCIRTDVKNFYDSIDRRLLLTDLDSDQLLSFRSKKYIKQALASYGSQSGNPNGIPRGLGISAYLSELYMRSIDEKIMQLPSVAYYARYVDDLIIIFAPNKAEDPTQYEGVISAILSERNLALNRAKTRSGYAGLSENLSFEYLGYSFQVAGGDCRLRLSGRKVARYRARIDRAFDAHAREATGNQKSAARMLAARIKFMTGNTRLSNNKRHAYTGIYFNNSHLTDLDQLNGLDSYLRYKVGGLQSAALQDKIYEFSFLRGFIERRFSKYSTRTLAEIVEAWQYEA